MKMAVFSRLRLELEDRESSNICGGFYLHWVKGDILTAGAAQILFDAMLTVVGIDSCMIIVLARIEALRETIGKE